MKKILALTLSGILVLGSSAIAIAAAADTDSSAPVQAEVTAAENNNLYLVPGTYASDAGTVENVIPSGATKLTDEECAEIFTPNAYLCNLAKGAKLPQPASERVDKNGTPYSFNGWWTIVDATVTYFETVPEITETTYLYADWRADLSQRKDPVKVDDSTIVKPAHYMSVTRAATGETEILTLRVSGSSDMNSMPLGYGAPVELYNGWFQLNPGDTITVYSMGLDDSEEAQVAPLDVSGRSIILESSGDGKTKTADYLISSISPEPTLTYKKSLKKGYYRIYIKFQSKGARMLVYMEPMN